MIRCCLLGEPELRAHDFRIVARYEDEWAVLLRCRRCDRWFVEMAHMHYAWAPREISGEIAKAMQNAPPELLHRAFNALQPTGSGELNVRSFEEILAG